MTRRLVIDASAAVELLRASELGDQVADALRTGVIAAPAHLDAEVLSALGRLGRAGVLADIDAERAIRHLQRLPVERYPLPPLLPRAWSLRSVTSLRDALYVACAESVRGTLLTLDGRLARGAPVPVQHLG